MVGSTEGSKDGLLSLGKEDGLMDGWGAIVIGKRLGIGVGIGDGIREQSARVS